MGTTLLIEPRTSEEMVCVCCHCHRERSEANEWRERVPKSGERLTHGICADCISELYPDIAHLVIER
jgi:hypothetical protein